MSLFKGSQQPKPLELAQTKSSFSRITLAVLRLCIYSYLAVVIGVWAILFFSGDRWWFGTVLLYGPRWIYAFPLVAFVPIALLWHRRWLWPLGVTAVIIAWPIMGLNASSSGWLDNAPQELRVLSYNVHRWGVMGEKFSDILDELQPDFAAIQECAAPRRFKREMKGNWFTHSAGYSIIVSRHPISRCETSKRGREINGLYCVVETPGGPIGFANVDMLTPRRALDKVLDRETIFDLSQVDEAQKRIDQRWQESESLMEWIRTFPEDRKIIAGDFNLTTDSPIYRNVWSVLQNSYSNTTFGYGYTKKTKVNRFRYGARIDHVLSTSSLKPLKAWVGADYGSDHLPLIAEFARD